ncbi:MAG: hypothetical protein ABI397_02705 [Candidatus Saccharimonas sp.]
MSEYVSEKHQDGPNPDSFAKEFGEANFMPELDLYDKLKSHLYEQLVLHAQSIDEKIPLIGGMRIDLNPLYSAMVCLVDAIVARPGTFDERLDLIVEIFISDYEERYRLLSNALGNDGEMAKYNSDKMRLFLVDTIQSSEIAVEEDIITRIAKFYMYNVQSEVMSFLKQKELANKRAE